MSFRRDVSINFLIFFGGGGWGRLPPTILKSGSNNGVLMYSPTPLTYLLLKYRQNISFFRDNCIAMYSHAHEPIQHFKVEKVYFWEDRVQERERLEDQVTVSWTLTEEQSQEGTSHLHARIWVRL